MIVQKTSVFPDSRKNVFEKLQKPETLQYIARPFATFEPIGKPPVVWREGSVSSYRFRLFGRIPYGTHTIRIIRFDSGGISSREGNEHVPVWNHDITLSSLDDDHTVYYRPGRDPCRMEDGVCVVMGEPVLYSQAEKMDSITGGYGNG